MPFVTLASQPAKEIFGGAITGRYAHLEKSTAGEVYLKAGTVVPMHQHMHEQFTYVLSGRFEFSIGDEKKLLGPGDAAFIPGGTIHGGTVVDDTRVLDVFAPVREDYR